MIVARSDAILLRGGHEPRAQNRTIFRAAVVPGPRAGPEAVTIGTGAVVTICSKLVDITAEDSAEDSI